MPATTHSLADLEEKVAAGKALTSAEAARVIACPDLVSVGVLGESARRAATGDTITFARVCAVAPGQDAVALGDAGEVRLPGAHESLADARARVRVAVPLADGRPMTGFALVDLLDCGGGDLTTLAEAARALKADGLEAVAEVAVDRFASTEALVAAARAVTEAGLGVWRLTVDRAGLAHDLRQVIREQVAAGRTDQEIRDFLVARYGEFALLKPAVSAPNAALWGAPILVLLVGGGLLAMRLRQRPETAALSPEEEARLAQLTREERD